MKKLFITSFLALVLIGYSYAQPPIPPTPQEYFLQMSQPNFAPLPGDVFVSYGVDVSDLNFSKPGFDYSNIHLNGEVKVIKYLSPALTPYYSYFHNATIAYQDGTKYFYEYADNKCYYSLGVADKEEIIYISDKYFNFPITFENGSHAGVVKDYIGISTVYSGTVNTTGIQEAFGNLKIPGTIWEKIVRMKTTYLSNISLSNTTLSHNQLKYSWYDGVHKNPVFTMSTDYVKETGQSDLISQHAYIADYALNNDLKKQLSSGISVFVFPNPVNSVLNLYIRLNSPGNANISLVSLISGKSYLLSSENLPAGQTSKAFQVRNIPKGMYLLKVAKDNDFQIIKVLLRGSDKTSN